VDIHNVNIKESAQENFKKGQNQGFEISFGEENLS